MNTVLITGAGLIGTLTARMLALRGDTVMLLDCTPHRKAIASVCESLPVTVVEGDVTDHAALLDLCTRHGVGAIVHTAALLSTAIRQSPRTGIEVNVMGCTNVLEVGRTLNLQRVVLASSATVAYPAFPAFDPAQGNDLSEDFGMRFLSHRPGSIYAATKWFGEHLGLLYRDLYDLSTVSLRYGAVVGAWEGPESSVPGRLLRMLMAAGRSGTQAVIDDPLLTWRGIEEFVDARDCASANVAALDAANPVQGVYNIGSGQGCSFEDVVAAVRQLHPGLEVQVKVPPAGGFAGFAHERPALGSALAARRELGWSARYGMSDSVAHFGRWFVPQPATRT